MTTAGLLLAAGAGRRFGAPKALVCWDDEPFVTRATQVLTEGGCSAVVVTLGARADEVRSLLPGTAVAVGVPDWAEGMGASLRAGLRALPTLDPVPDAVLVHLVDLPGVGSEVIARLRTYSRPDALARAAYAGVPGHPVLFGRRWWDEIAAHARGDRGARGWLGGRDDVVLVECGDIASGTDVDTPADLGPYSGIRGIRDP